MRNASNACGRLVVSRERMSSRRQGVGVPRWHLVIGEFCSVSRLWKGWGRACVRLWLTERVVCGRVEEVFGSGMCYKRTPEVTDCGRFVGD